MGRKGHGGQIKEGEGSGKLFWVFQVGSSLHGILVPH